MTRPTSQRLLTEANAATYAADPSSPLGQAIAARAAESRFTIDPTDPDALIVTPTTGGTITEDPTDPDAIVIDV